MSASERSSVVRFIEAHEHAQRLARTVAGREALLGEFMAMSSMDRSIVAAVDKLCDDPQTERGSK